MTKLHAPRGARLASGIGRILGRSQGVDADARFTCAECGYVQDVLGARFCRRCGMPRPQAAPTGDAVSVATATDIGVARSSDFILPRPKRDDPPSVPSAREATHTPKRPNRVLKGHASQLAELPEEMSAKQTITHEQVVVLRIAAVALILFAIVNGVAAAIAVIALITSLYLGALVFRARIFWRALHDPTDVTISDDEARGIWDHTLPTYTVLVPAYGEPQVIGQLIRSIAALEYPPERLDVKLLLEADDTATIQAAEAAKPGDHFEIVRVPYSEPRTKPKACNYGLRHARGKLLTIYDAEDQPEPLQLRRAVAAFRRLDETYACLQAKLVYHNPGQNNITRWFTTEYAMWFSQLLPGLIRDSAPLPLGGTSNHFRRDVLDRLGGWDPYNVTEDADLGIRLHRAGYRTGVLDSTTYEEANSDFVNWVKQRSRWYKGYMQTWLVHMRHPRQLIRELGIGGFIGFNLFVGGTPFLALLNPVFWMLTIAWFIGHLGFIQNLFPWWLYYVGLFCLVGGNVLFVYTNMIAARQHGNPALVIAAVFSPIYWVMMSIAAVKALAQLITAPSFWEKTTHGLDQHAAAGGQDAVA